MTAAPVLALFPFSFIDATEERLSHAVDEALARHRKAEWAYLAKGHEISDWTFETPDEDSEEWEALNIASNDLFEARRQLYTYRREQREAS